MRLLPCVIGLLSSFLLSIPAAGQPVISVVVNAASYEAGVAPGSIVSIFGTGLAGQPAQAASVPLPTTLGNTSVTVSGQGSIPLYFVSPNQINAVVPFQIPIFPGPAAAPTLVVTTSAGISRPFSLEVRPAIPGLFTISGSGQGQALLFNPDFSAATELLPGGSYATYVVGLGGVQPVPLAGNGGATTEPLNRTAPIQIVVGETAIAPDFSGIAPGLVNVYQVNFTLPADFVPASDRIFVRAQGWQSNAASFRVAPSNLIAQGTVQPLYPYTPRGGGMMPAVTFGVLLEAGAFTLQMTLPATNRPVRIAAVTDAGSTVIRLNQTGGNWNCLATQTAATSPERQGDFNALLPSTPIVDFTAGPLFRSFPANVLPFLRLDPVWVTAVGQLPAVNSALAPDLNGSVQSVCSVGAGGIFLVNATSNQAVSLFGGFRMLPYALLPNRTSTFKLYVNSVVIAQEQVQFQSVSQSQ